MHLDKLSGSVSKLQSKLLVESESIVVLDISLCFLLRFNSADWILCDCFAVPPDLAREWLFLLLFQLYGHKS